MTREEEVDAVKRSDQAPEHSGDRLDDRDRQAGTASDQDPDHTEKGKSKAKQSDEAETEEQAEDTFPASDAPAW